MTIKNHTISVCLGLIVVLGGWIATHQSPPTDTKQPANQYGSVSSPDISSPYISVNNLQTWSATFPMVQNSSTTCQFQTPNATTTLTAFSYRFGLASSTSAQIEMGKAAGPNATTTLFGTTFTVGAGAQATVEASSTNGSAGDTAILAPSSWLAVKLAGGGLGSLPTGSCNFEVQALP